MANSDINSGANILASLNLSGEREVQLRMAAQQMGLSEQEGALLVRRAIQKAQKRSGGVQGLEQVVDTFIRRGAQVAGVNADIPANIDDLRTIPNEQIAFGEFGNQDELQNFGGRDDQGNIGDVAQQIKELEQAQGKKDPNVLARTYFEKGKDGVQREEMYIPDGMPVPARFVEPAKNRDFGIYQEGVAAPAAQVQREAQLRLQQNVDQFGADTFPGAVDVIGRINDDIQGNRSAEQSLVREMVGQERNGLASGEIRRRADIQLAREFAGNDTPGAAMRAMPVDAYEQREAAILGDLGRIRRNAEAVEANNWRAQAAANVIGQDFQVGGRGARADQAMENIGQIAELGPAKVAYDFNVSRNPVDRGTAIPDSLPLNLPDQYNAPATDNRFAGPLQRQEQWLVDALGAVRDPNMAGAYPDVGINEQMGAARQAIQNAKIRGQNVDLGDMQIRNIADLQAAADQVIGLAQQKGVAFFNNVDGKNVANPNPGIGEVLERGGMNARQVGDVAKAGFAVEAAMKNPANQGRKELFQEGITLRPMVNPINFGGDHPALGGGAAKIAMLNREKVEGKELKGQLQRLDGKRGNPGEPLNQQELADARMPFQAGVAGEGVPRARFVRGGDRQLSTDQIYEKYGPVNGQIANAVIQRAEQAQGTNSDGFGVRVERQRNMDPGPRFDPGPDPWSQPVGTGNGISNEIAKRSGGNAQQALPYGISTSGPAQGPVPGSARKQFTDRATNFGKSPKYERINRYGRRSAIAGGGVAGLAGIDALIGGERNKREEEQY